MTVQPLPGPSIHMLLYRKRAHIRLGKQAHRSREPEGGVLRTFPCLAEVDKGSRQRLPRRFRLGIKATRDLLQLLIAQFHRLRWSGGRLLLVLLVLLLLVLVRHRFSFLVCFLCFCLCPQCPSSREGFLTAPEQSMPDARQKAHVQWTQSPTQSPTHWPLEGFSLRRALMSPFIAQIADGLESSQIWSPCV